MLLGDQEILSTRVAILINWLHAPEYAIYNNKGSTINLLKTIDIIRWSLDHTLPMSDWQQFNTELLAAEKALLEEDKTEEQKENNYNEVLKMLEATLYSFLAFVNKGANNPS